MKEFHNALSSKYEDELACDECETRLTEYIHAKSMDMDLTLILVDVEQHIQVCPYCAQSYNELIDLVQMANAEGSSVQEQQPIIDLSFLREESKEKSTPPADVREEPLDQVRTWLDRIRSGWASLVSQPVRASAAALLIVLVVSLFAVFRPISVSPEISETTNTPTAMSEVVNKDPIPTQSESIASGPTFIPSETPTPASEPVQADGIRGNDTCEHAYTIPPYTLISNSLESTEDRDWYVYQVPSDVLVTFTFTHTNARQFGFIDFGGCGLLDSENDTTNLMGTQPNYNTSGGYAQIKYRLESTSEIYLMVGCKQGFPCEEPYSIQINIGEE
ncbi:MAG: hypothetical protein AAF702_01445 [Chloroflexota bacterium]